MGELDVETVDAIGSFLFACITAGTRNVTRIQSGFLVSTDVPYRAPKTSLARWFTLRNPM